LSLRDVIQLSGEVLIVDATSKRQAELRQRARDVGVPYSRYERMGKGGLDKLQKAVEAAEKAKAAEEGYKERNPEEAEPEAKEAEQPAAEEAGPRTVDEWIEYIKAGEADGSVESRKEEMKSAPPSAWKTPGGNPIKGLTTTRVAKVLDAFPKEKKFAETYPENGKHKEFLATLDDKVVLDLLKLKQKIQPGLQIEFEGEKKQELQPSDHTEENFVAEIFRVKEGLTVGDIYREDDPTDIVISGDISSPDKKKEEPVSPIDMAVNELKLDGIKQPTVDQLVTKIQELIKVKTISPDSIDSTKLDPEAIANKARLKADAKLLPRDIDKVKQALKELGVIREGTSQKNLLRQLTLLSR
jgi:hypothetical protein